MADAAEIKPGKTVLLVDGDPHNRVFIGDRLRFDYRWQIDLLVASSGEEALKLTENLDGSLGLVLMDIRMPGIGGLEAIRQMLVKHPAYKGKIVACSNEDPSIYWPKARQAGANELIPKNDDAVSKVILKYLGIMPNPATSP